MRVYLGYDSREQAAFDVAEKTAKTFGCEVIPLREDRLRSAGILTRPTDNRGELYDLNSGQPQSTQFAIARFVVPIIAHSGWCLFADCDTVFMEDPHELLSIADDSKAVMVVKHPAYDLTDTKMDGRTQKFYPRKFWSSVILWNCDHPANQRLNLMLLNQWHRDDLHAFKWLVDDEIGDLPETANWLAGIVPKPARPMIAHFTLGGPWIEGWTPHEHDELWLSQR